MNTAITTTADEREELRRRARRIEANLRAEVSKVERLQERITFEREALARILARLADLAHEDNTR